MPIHKLLFRTATWVTLGGLALAPAWAADSGSVARAATRQTPAEQGATDQPSMAGPVYGLLADDDNLTIRGLVGIPGAATISGALGLQRGIHNVHLIPGQRRAVAVSQTQIGVVALDGRLIATLEPIEGLAGEIGMIGFAPGGSAAVLLSVDRSQLQVVEQLTGNPSVKWQAGISLLEPKSVLVNDAATVAVVLTAAGEVYSVRAGAPPQLVFQSAKLGAATFLPGQSRLAVVDQASDSLNVITNLDGNAAAGVVANQLGLSKGTVLLKSSTDGSWLVGAIAGGLQAVKINVSTGTVTSVSLPVRASRLDQIGTDNAFVTSFVDGGEAWLLVDRPTGLQAVFAASSPAPPRRSLTDRRER